MRRGYTVTPLGGRHWEESWQPTPKSLISSKNKATVAFLSTREPRRWTEVCRVQRKSLYAFALGWAPYLMNGLRDIFHLMNQFTFWNYELSSQWNMNSPLRRARWLVVSILKISISALKPLGSLEYRNKLLYLSKWLHTEQEYCLSIGPICY